MNDNGSPTVTETGTVRPENDGMPPTGTADAFCRNRVADMLAELEGVVAFRYLDQRTLSDIRESETGVVVTGGMRYENRALDDCVLKDAVMCVFCKGPVEEQREISMVMMDDFGNITGNDVPPCMMDEYRSRDDLVWLSENFVIYSRARQLSESRIVLLPRRFSALDGMEGVSDPVCFYPNVSSDRILKERYMDRYDPYMCTLIIGFDICRYRTEDPVSVMSGIPRPCSPHGNG